MSENENVRTKVNIKENGMKVFGTFFVIIVSVFILAVLIKLLFTNSKINQGKFRVVDVLVTSGAEFVDKSKGTGKWMYDISQKNILSLLINTSGAEISRVYITDAKTVTDNIEISQKDSETYITCNTDDILELASDVSDDGSVVYDIEIVRRNVLNNFEIPADITEIRHDASIFSLAGLENLDLSFSVSFTFNMQEKNGKLSSMKITLDLPYDNIVQSGTYVEKLDLQNFVFKTD